MQKLINNLWITFAWAFRWVLYTDGDMKTTNETKRQQEERDVNILIKNLRKEHEKEILIHGIFVGVIIGSLLTGIMIEVFPRI